MFGRDIILKNWYAKGRKINWALHFGLEKKSVPAITGSFYVTPHYLDDQGEKWGDTHVQDIGKYFDEYSHWFNRQRMHPIGGTDGPPHFEINGFNIRQFKSAAHGVTGLLGEVLVTILFQDELNIKPNNIAFLSVGNEKTPDIVLDIEPSLFSNLIRSKSDSSNYRLHKQNLTRASIIDSFNWEEPVPVECKSSRTEHSGDMRKALQQLLSYWSIIDSMAGIGLFAQINVIPTARIDLFLLVPENHQKQLDILRIARRDVWNTSLVRLSEDPLLHEIKEAIGGKFLG
jgi:hypothetical protein